MKKALGCMGAIIECLLFLWLVIGLWACANKIRELEDSQHEYAVGIETPANKLLLVAMRCQKMEQDNDMLRLRIEELEDAISAVTNSIPNHAVKKHLHGGELVLIWEKIDELSGQVNALKDGTKEPLIPLTRENENFIQSSDVMSDDLIDQDDYVE